MQKISAYIKTKLHETINAVILEKYNYIWWSIAKSKGKPLIVDDFSVHSMNFPRIIVDQRHIFFILSI